MQNESRKWTTGWQGLLALCTAAWLLAVCVTPAHAATGDLDVRFGDHGRLAVPGAVQAVVMQPDGGLLFVDGTATLQVRRFLANGTPDLQFGTAGRIEVKTPSELQAFDLSSVAATLQSDGKLLIAGSWFDGWGWGLRFIARLDPAQGGALDPTFGDNGVVRNDDAGSGYSRVIVLPRGDVVALVERRQIEWLDSSGRRIATYESDTVDIAALDGDSVALLERHPSGVALFRLKRDGLQTFGGSNVLNFAAQRIAVDSMGRIVICGGPEFHRYTPTGAPEWQVQHGSVSSVQIDSCDALATDASGRILAIVSDTAPRGNGLRTIVMRLRSDGSLDPAVVSPTAAALLRGQARPTEEWHPLGLLFTGAGDARMAWRLTSSTANGQAVVDAIDLAGNVASSGIGIAAFEPKANERAGFAEFPVVRSGSSNSAASVRYEILAGTAGADDIDLSSGTLTWAAGDATRRSIRIALRDDSLNEGEETFTVRLLDGSGVTVPTQPLRVTLVDDEALRSLAFAPSNVTWAQSSTGPWPKVELAPVGAGSPGPVTAYYLFINGFDMCCVDGVRWTAGSATALSISLTQELGLGNSFSVVVIDDEWQEVGPSATITVQIPSSPPSVTPPTTPSPSGGGGSGGGGGGGSVGLFDLLLGCLGAAMVARVRRRANRTFR